MTEKTTRSSGHAKAETKSDKEASPRVTAEDLPDPLGNDFGVYIRPNYVRARLEEDGENYAVVNNDGLLDYIPAEEFSGLFRSVSPSKVLDYAYVPTSAKPPE